MIQPHRNVLCSYHYFKDYDFTRLPDLNIIADSGAFSAMSQGATITVDDLAAWAKDWSGVFKWVASLDVIGDPDGTRRNWERARDRHGLEAIPTIHWGSDPSLMDWYVEQGVDLMGLGGMVGKSSDKQMRWLVSVFKHQQRHHPDLGFHGWGVTSPKVMRLPFYSVDSSGWASVFRFGQVVVRDPRTGRLHKYQADGRDLKKKPQIARLLRAEYGINPDDVLVSNSSNRQLHARIALAALHVQEKQFQKMHGPARAPRFGVNYDRDPALEGGAPRAMHGATAMITNAHPEVAQRQFAAATTSTTLHEDNQRDIATRTLVAADSDTKQFEDQQARIAATKQPA